MAKLTPKEMTVLGFWWVKVYCASPTAAQTLRVSACGYTDACHAAAELVARAGLGEPETAVASLYLEDLR